MSSIGNRRLVASSNASSTALLRFFESHESSFLPGSEEYKGFKIAGPALFGYFEWLDFISAANKIDCLIFLDGETFRLFKYYKENVRNHHKSNDFLLEISEPRIFLSGLHEYNYITKLEFFIRYINIGPSFIDVEALGIPMPASHVLNEMGLADIYHISPSNAQMSEKLLSVWRSHILKAARAERRKLLQTIISFGVTEGQRIVIVDPSSSGVNLENFANATKGIINLELWGCSFALSGNKETFHRANNLRLYGFLDGKNTKPGFISSIKYKKSEFNNIFGVLDRTEDNNNGGYSHDTDTMENTKRGAQEFFKKFSVHKNAVPTRIMASDLTKPLIDYIG